MTLPPGDLALPVSLPDDDTLCGAHLDLRGLTADPGVSSTHGLDRLLGE